MRLRGSHSRPGRRPDSVLQQVGAALGAAFEEREGELRRSELAEDDDSRLGARLAQVIGSLDPFVGIAGRHADVGENDVRRVGFDRRAERGQIVTRGKQVDVGLLLEQA